MKKSLPNLSPAQIERLALLAEELGETVQAVCKVLRHGYDTYNPDIAVDDDHLPPTNCDDLEKEIGHVLAAVDILARHDIYIGNVVRAKEAKAVSVYKWLHHQEQT